VPSQAGEGTQFPNLAALTVSSTFAEGQPIPADNACSIPKKDGCDLGASPKISWTAGPAQTGSYAILVCDPDGGNWLHWIVSDIGSSTTSLDAAASGHCKSQLPAGANDGLNQFGTVGYGGPCPPAGSGVHHYIFTVYALSVARATLPGTSSCDDVRASLESQAIAKGSLTGTFKIDR
jgi:Raf kinase inhibitor-like YbhB/YbcL family protein